MDKTKTTNFSAEQFLQEIADEVDRLDAIKPRLAFEEFDNSVGRIATAVINKWRSQ